ncbi:zinc-finger-containing protein [Parendozoicomonas haliclonae]|uniref:Uncharacterized protein n=1 Tax=Parendozoicomonas haliclonae TaxID=1960125 RepID=A0A1X7AE51_9GAMM|nr:zinc-finger-containing protein [Parendozoicomonas haliclonae]SMA33446.1 hypothetical protein EHSB41UT_00283 [Parendozoicomonas haliclonae]
MKKERVSPWNPSRRATERVKNPLPAPTTCNCCGKDTVELQHHDQLYGRSYGNWPYVYRCTSCHAYVGLHPFTSIPLGTLADQATREARKRCKPPFEDLHRSGRMSRNEAYAKLAAKLQIPVAECHFGWFDAAMCERARQAAIELGGT